MFVLQINIMERGRFSTRNELAKLVGENDIKVKNKISSLYRKHHFTGLVCSRFRLLIEYASETIVSEATVLKPLLTIRQIIKSGSLLLGFDLIKI